MMTDEQAEVSKLQNAPLAEIVRGAWQIGRTIDLSGIGYGRIHWGNFKDIITEPLPYYFFLAGITRLCTAARICELGTHWGGSTRALRRGVPAGTRPDIVTIDLSRKSQLAGEDGIRKIVGEAGSKAVIQATVAHFGAQAGIELLFIDSHHTFSATLAQYCQYTTLLRPKFTILDDISLNEEMAEVWQLVLSSVLPGEALDTSDIEPDIRGATGFGLVRFKHNFSLAPDAQRSTA